jgi:hypothetical protein
MKIKGKITEKYQLEKTTNGVLVQKFILEEEGSKLKHIISAYNNVNLLSKHNENEMVIVDFAERQREWGGKTYIDKYLNSITHSSLPLEDKEKKTSNGGKLIWCNYQNKMRPINEMVLQHFDGFDMYQSPEYVRALKHPDAIDEELPF